MQVTYLSILKKCIICTIASFVIGVGVVLYIRCNLGVDPMSVFAQGLSKIFNVRFGDATIISSSTFLVVGFFFARENIGFGTIFTTLISGKIINLTENMLLGILPMGANYSMPMRAAMLIGGVIFLSLGLAGVVSCRFGYNSFDVNLFKIVDLTKIEYRWIKIVSDCTFVLLGYLLGGTAGIGTLAGAFLVGPIITEFVKVYNKTILKTMNMQDVRNEFN